jgi:hypothetical protein
MEEVCYREEINSQRALEFNLNKLKAGADIENKIITNYLSNENRF